MALARDDSYLQRFSEIVAHFPTAPAVLENDRTVTYDEFGAFVRRLAFALRKDLPEPRVLIHLPQMAEAYAAMFAAGLAGGFYSTTNAATPPHRRQHIFATFMPDAVVTNMEMAEEARRNAPSAKIITVEALGTEELREAEPPHRIAYVMFTSGSTGIPKGVVISKSALSHYVDWMMDAMAISPSDRMSQHPNIAFDLSVLDIYGALCAGAALVPITGERLLLPAAAIRRHKITIWNSVPSVLTSMIKIRQVNPKNFATLRLATFCGEPLQRMHVEAIFKARPDLVVHNTYGPTEATVSCTLLRLDADNYTEACQSSVAIGDSIKDMSIDLLGGASANEGEIIIAGPQLADGYWNDPELTAKCFRPIVRDGRQVRSYHTGDFAYRVGRHVYFRGRSDFQVKVRGERIELDDIAAALMACCGCFACAVLVNDELHGVLETAGPPPEAGSLRQKVAQYLPLHLIPGIFHAIPELPRNANGKVDITAVTQLLENKAR